MLAALLVGGFVMAPGDVSRLVKDIWSTIVSGAVVVVRSSRRVFEVDRPSTASTAGRCPSRAACRCAVWATSWRRCWR
jgi:hypothetical protein